MARDYDPALLVHDTLPLIRDEETGELRFARIGYDDPATWVADAAGLPEAAITVHVFDNHQKLDGWMAAATRFAGNHVRISRVPSHGPQVALEVDYSRDRNPGTTLDEAVELAIDPQIRDPDSIRSMVKRGRESLAERNLADLGTDAHENAWKDEIATLKSLGVSVRSHTPSDKVNASSPLSYETKARDISRFTLYRAGEGYLVTWWAKQFSADEPDLVDELAGIHGKLRLSAHDDGDVAMPVSEITEATLDAVASTATELYDEIKRLSDVGKGRAHARKAMANDKMMAVLRKARAGAPVTTSSIGNPGDQVNPKTGTVQAVPQTHFSTAFKDGWLTLAFSGGQAYSVAMSNPQGTRVPLVLVLTPAGAALCDGDIERARVLVGESIEANRTTDTRAATGGDLVTTLLEATTWLEDAAREKLAAAMTRKFETDDTIEDMARRGIDYGDGWCLAVAGIVAGVVGLREDGRPEMLADSGNNPAPGM